MIKINYVFIFMNEKNKKKNHQPNMENELERLSGYCTDKHYHSAPLGARNDNIPLLEELSTSEKESILDFIREWIKNPTEYDLKLDELIKENEGRPHCFQGGHPAVGIIIYAIIMAGVIPSSIHHSVQFNGLLKGIPQGLFNGVATTATASLYIPTVTTMVVSMIPIGMVNILTLGKFDIVGRFRYMGFKTMYSYEKLLKNLFYGNLSKKKLKKE